MPTFENYTESQVTKTILLGHSGSGKTGSTVALAAAGYNVFILDLDKGSELIKDFVINPASPYVKGFPGHWTAAQAAGIASRVRYTPIDETLNVKNGIITPKADMWKKAMSQLDNWKDEDREFGNISTWGAKDVLVIDGLSRLSDAAFYHQLAMNGRLNTRPEQSDFGIAQDMIKRFLMLLYSSEVKCNVVMICHIGYVETESGPTRGFAQSVGKALSPKIGQYFNHALLAKAKGKDRVLLTNTDGMIELKSAAPLRVKPEYPISTGLADYFRDVRGLEAPK